MTLPAILCDLCASPSVCSVPVSAGGWTWEMPNGRNGFMPYRPVQLCVAHRDVRAGSCDCRGVYGATGSRCETCRERRTHVVQRPATIGG